MARPLIPWGSLALVALLLVLAVAPGAAGLLEYDASRHDAPWRLLTSQLVHWSTGMVVADVLLLGIAGSIVERRSRRLAWTATLLGAAGTALAVALGGLTRYRGSSGIGTALLVAGGLDLAARGASRPARTAGAAALAAGVLKLALDASGLAPSALPPGVVPATGVHAAAVAGGVVAWLSARRRAP